MKHLFTLMKHTKMRLSEESTNFAGEINES